MPGYAYERYRAAFAEAVARALTAPLEEIERAIKPAEPAHGDFAFAAFASAKIQRKPPAAIASALQRELSIPGMQFSAAGPYLNARLEAAPFAEEVLQEVGAAGLRYGASQVGAGKSVVIDYSSPNIAKPIAFHHIRSTVIGHSLANLYRSQGYRVEGINYLGDWGKQFGLVAIGFEEFGDASRKREMAHLVEVYVKANRRAEEDPAFDARAREFFRRMESGDPKALAVWRDFRETSLADFRGIYRRLDIDFEHYEGESHYQGRMDAVIERVAKTVGVKESQGALVVDMPYGEGEPPVLLRKQDGSTLYATRDLAAAIDRYERFQFHLALYVVALDQAFYFRQLFAVLERMGMSWAKRCVHVGFGRVHGMSTRRGQVVLLEDVLDEARSRALEKVSENQKAGRIETDVPEQLAEQVGLGAIIFGDLKNRRTTDYTFDWEEVLSFEGHTGPYLQYAHARACSILRKAGEAPARPDGSRLPLPEEQAVIRAVARFPSSVASAVAENEPSAVARHLLELAAEFSKWYTLGNQDRDKRVLVDDAPTRAARLSLTEAVRLTLGAGLSLLGIPAPQRM